MIVKPVLMPHWLIACGLLSMLLALNIACHIWGDQIQIGLAQEQRETIRTALYATAIALFPLTNLLRHILLRLNQTMPLPGSAGRRYLATTALTLGLIEWVGLFGFAMFVLGDDFNTLYIFDVLAILGVFLHRPKMADYLAIEQAIIALSIKDEQAATPAH